MATTVYDLTTVGGLPPGWTRRGVTTTDETWSSSGLSVSMGEAEGYYFDAPASGDFAVEMAVTSDSVDASVMFGPWILDASGNGKLGSWYTGPTGALLLSVGGYLYPGGFVNMGGAKAEPYRFRLSYTATSGNVTLSYSLNDGATWAPESAPMALGTTPTRVGFGRIFGGGTDMHVVTEVKVIDSLAGVVRGALAATLPGPLS